MSLIVTRQINNEVFVIADTKFTISEEKVPKQAEQYIGGLKAIILLPGLFVAFAGDVYFAKIAIERIYNKKINLLDKNKIIDYFLFHHYQSSYQTDFIVGVIVEDNENPEYFGKEVFKIANGMVQWEKQTTYIGDKDAFSKFQEHFHSNAKKHSIFTFEITKLGSEEVSDFHDNLAKSMEAMMHVIDDPEVRGVDGMRTVVISENNEFHYVQSFQIRGDPLPIINESNSPVYFGGAAEGSDIKYISPYSGVGHGIFSVFSLTGKFGIIYHPEISFKPTLLKCGSIEEFIEHVKKEFPMRMEEF